MYFRYNEIKQCIEHAAFFPPINGEQKCIYVTGDVIVDSNRENMVSHIPVTKT